MKKSVKFLTVIALIAVIALTCVAFTACNDDTDTIKVVAPEGTPALAIARLVTQNKSIGGKDMQYEIVNPDNIAAQMTSKIGDVIVMAVNAGAKLITQGAPYKLVSVAVNGSLFMVGKSESAREITFEELYGKRVACIGQTGVPGLVFRYVMANNNVKLVNDQTTPNAENKEVSVRYVKDGTAARSLLAGDEVDYAVVGEPAATAFKAAIGAKAEMNMQTKYAAISGKNNFPQAGLFVKTALYQDEKFMNELFEALSQSKAWVEANPTQVTEFVKKNLYESAAFPPASIARCAIDCAKLSNDDKTEIIAFLKNVMPKDSTGAVIDWDAETDKIF